MTVRNEMARGRFWGLTIIEIFCELLKPSEGLLDKTIKQKYL
jgi:hypothetical protein